MKSLKFLLCAVVALSGALALILASDPTAVSISFVSILCVIGYASLLDLGIKYYNAH